MPSRAAAGDGILDALSGKSHAGPGELSAGEGVVLAVLLAAAYVAPAFTIAEVSRNPPHAIPRGAAIGLTAAGGTVGLVTAAFVPSRRSDAALFMYSFTSGFSLGVAGAGVGGLVGPADWRAALLGPSAGYVLGATTTAVMALARGGSSQGLGGTAMAVGGVGTLGCFAIAAGGFKRGVEGYGGLGVACTTLGALSFLVGLAELMSPSTAPAAPAAPAPPPWTPIPWVKRGAAGVAIGGAF